MKILMSIVLIFILGMAGVATFVLTGVYNVSAIKQDPAAIRWLIEQVREYSIERRAEKIVPPDLSERGLILSGASAYDEMCSRCHGAPGRNPFVGARDMNPEPPNLAELPERPAPNELFWAIKNGIRMTGMPAWGKSHSDEAIWELVAFVEQLPGLSSAEYNTMLSEASAGGHGHEYDEAEHRHPGT